MKPEEKRHPHVTAPSINPRRFSRGEANLNPEADISVYMSLIIPGKPDAVTEAFKLIDRQKEDWPQAKAAPVALGYEKGHYTLTIEVKMGPAREALQNQNPQVAAGYGFLHALARNLYNYRPVFTVPPTEVEREAFRNLTANPRKRLKQETN